MKEIRIEAENGAYALRFERGLIETIGEQLPEYRGACWAIVSDRNVDALYGERVERSLRAADMRAARIVFPAGEATKCAARLNELYEALYDLGITRTDGILALGGGVIGDLAGFAAATYLRGIPIVQVPTSLLAQVDSSVGGKTAIDLSRGKNLVGAFYPPARVLIDVDTLRTLDARQLRAGLAEAIKTGAIYDAELFEHFEHGDVLDFEMIVRRCCERKAACVALDPLDKGERMKLNFGHTLGHAIETASAFRLLHGEAVALGMIGEARWCERLGVTPAGTAERLTAVLRRHGLPTETPAFSPDALLEPLLRDKKRAGDTLRLIALSNIGEARILRVPVQEVEAWLR